MGPNVPTGYEARVAWRALSPQGRRAAWVAAKEGTSPGDPGLGLAAAAYAKRMIRILRVVLAVIPLSLLVLVLLATGLALASRAFAGLYFTVLLPGLFLAYVVGVILVRRRVRQYAALHNSGMLAVEAAQAGAVATADPNAWRQGAYQSEFTVPYQAGIRVAQPRPRPPADPTGAGTHEIRMARWPLVVQLTLSVVLVGLLWLAGSSLGPDREVTTLRLIVDALAVVYTGLVAFSVLVNLPLLIDPRVARLAPDGWSQPVVRTAGRWDGVREIRVRSYASGMGTRPTRAVVLVVDDPQAQIERIPVPRRWIARRSVRRYGSPIVIPASPRTMVAPDVVALLQRYTDAPVTWG
jgi:hypothetical protein